MLQAQVFTSGDLVKQWSCIKAQKAKSKMVLVSDFRLKVTFSETCQWSNSKE